MHWKIVEQGIYARYRSVLVPFPLFVCFSVVVRVEQVRNTMQSTAIEIRDTANRGCGRLRSNDWNFGNNPLSIGNVSLYFEILRISADDLTTNNCFMLRRSRSIFLNSFLASLSRQPDCGFSCIRGERVAIAKMHRMQQVSKIIVFVLLKQFLIFMKILNLWMNVQFQFNSWSLYFRTSKFTTNVMKQ